MLRELVARISANKFNCSSDSYNMELEIGLIYAQLHQYAQSEDAPAPQKTLSCLQTLMSSFNMLPNGLTDGNMGLIWLLGRLVKGEILEKPEGLFNLAYEAIKKNSAYFANSPIQIDWRQRLYPIGVAMMALHSGEDSIERFTWDEQIIFRLCDCHKALVTTIHHIYSPLMLTAGILHSIYAFAKLAYGAKLYTYKAAQIMDCVRIAEYDYNGSDRDDILLLDLMLDRPSSVRIEDYTYSEIWALLSYAGTLSLMYEQSELFKKVYALCEKIIPDIEEQLSHGDISEENLVGVTLGLINRGKDE